MEFTFETEIHDCALVDLCAPLTVEITYTATPDYLEGRCSSRRTHEIEVIETKYFQFGTVFHCEGKTWNKLEHICHERALEHFEDYREAA